MSRARMPWHGDIAHEKLSDGRIVLRGSRESAVDKFGEDAVDAVTPSDAIGGSGSTTGTWNAVTMGTDRTRAVWQTVKCPTCHAGAGLACEDEDGYRQPDRPQHPARITAFLGGHTTDAH